MHTRTRSTLAIALLGTATLSACADLQESHNKGVAAANAATVQIESTRADVERQRLATLQAIAAGGDTTVKAVAAMAAALGGSADRGGGPARVAVPQQVESQALQWARIAAPTGAVLVAKAFDSRVAIEQARANRDVSIAQTHGWVSLGSAGFAAQADIAKAGYGALVGQGEAALGAAADIAGHIQAPAANITVIGSGNTKTITDSYNQPVTTTTTDRHDTTTMGSNNPVTNYPQAATK